MTILITGATGLVGSRLVPRLVATGHDCRVLVRSAGTAPEGTQVVEGDLFDATSLREAVAGVEAIVHLAAVFRTPDADLIWKSNLEGTRNVIAATQAGAPSARFVLASTSNVYGEGGGRPGREEDEVDPQHPYPASKLAAERLLRETDLTWSILRFGFVYGDGDGHLEALPAHATRAGWHPGKRISVVHHRDIATAVDLALRGDLDSQVVNIADDAPTTVYELVELTGGQLAPSARPLADPWHLHVDNARARALGFQPVMRTVYQARQEALL
jgi:nucleoside-diphosphate-sugar epimerase